MFSDYMKSLHFYSINTVLSMARVYYHCMLGFAGQFTTVLLSLQAYLYCIQSKTFTNKHEIRRNDKGTKETINGYCVHHLPVQ